MELGEDILELLGDKQYLGPETAINVLCFSGVLLFKN